MNRHETRLAHIGRGFLFGIGALVFAGLIALLFGWILMLLWNWLMPELFHLPSITYWQGWGLILLSHLLFKGNPGGGHGHHGFQRHPMNRRTGNCRDGADMDQFKREFRERMYRKWHDQDEIDPEEGTDR